MEQRWWQHVAENAGNTGATRVGSVREMSDSRTKAELEPVEIYRQEAAFMPRNHL